MPRKKDSFPVGPALSERQLLRSTESFNKRALVGMTVSGNASKPKILAVRKTAKKFGRSERYVWGTVKLGSKLYAATLAILEKASRDKRSRPRTVAGLFLLRELGSDPRPMKEIAALTRTKNIMSSTLRRACKDLSVRKKRIGGQHGYWSWELPRDTKIKFGIDD